MPEISIKKNSTDKSVYLRFITTSPVAPATVDDETEGLELWYRRTGEERVEITPVALSSLLAAHAPGGIEPVDDGYSRLDLPDEALEAGADSVQVGGSAEGILGIGVLIQLIAPDTTTGSGQATEGTTLVDCSVQIPESPLPTHEGCPILTKRRLIQLPKGLCGTAVWTMRLPSGAAANFSDCITQESETDSVSIIDSHDIKVRFGSCSGDAAIAETDGWVLDTSSGLIEFEIPEEVCQVAGIYEFQPALMKNGSPVFMDRGLISVERGLWGDTSNTGGSPSIQEIRFAIMDRPEENDLLRAVEFDDNDILEAIRWPVFQFNETSPDLGHRFNCNNFPFRYHWIQAIVGRLLMAAVNHYVRNKMLAQSGGLQVDDKNKDLDYARIAGVYLEEWRQWMNLKKIELNASQAWGSLGSSYGSGSYYGSY